MWSVYITTDSSIINYFINVTKKDLYKLYINIINEEISNNIKDDIRLSEKIDWFKECYDIDINYNSIVYNTRLKCFELNRDRARNIFEYDIDNLMSNTSIIMRFVHINDCGYSGRHLQIFDMGTNQ